MTNRDKDRLSTYSFRNNYPSRLEQIIEATDQIAEDLEPSKAKMAFERAAKKMKEALALIDKYTL